MLFVSKKKDALLRWISALLFFVFPCFLSAQAAPPSSEARSPAAVQEADAQAQPRLGRETDESLILIDPPAGLASSGPAAADAPRAYSSAGAVLRLIVVLILLCVACYFIVRLLRKSQRGQADSDPFLKMVASLSLGQEKSVAVVTLGGRAFLVGVAEHSVSLIAEITDTELIDQMNLSSSVNTPVRKSFAEMLSDLIPKFRKEVGSFSTSSAEETATFIRQRRERLKDKEGSEK